MSLPSSREETATSANPVKAAVINAIQDACIGWKHVEIKTTYPATRFVWSAGFTISNGAQINSTAAGSAYCGLDVVVGDRITTVKWGYIVGASGSITMKLCRRILDGSAAVEVITPFSGTTLDNTGTTFETNTVTYNHTVVDGYVYFLQVDVTNNASNLFGAVVGEDRL